LVPLSKHLQNLTSSHDIHCSPLIQTPSPLI
jgi:hypothetical protein